MALPPGPIAHPAIQTYRFIKEPLPFFEECRWHHGDLFTIQMLGIGKCVHVCRPETVRELFPADPEHLHAGASNSLIEPLGGKASVALADERGHARMRRVLNLPLHGPKMRKHGRTMRDAARFAMRDFRAGDVRAMLPLTQDIPLEVILRVVFGIQSRDLLPEAAAAVLEMVTAYTPLLLIVPQTRRDFGRHSPGGRFARRRAVVDAWIRREIKERRAAADTERADVLSLLLIARDENDEPLADDEIRDQLITLFVDGQDTTSAALAWAMSLLHANPDVLERLRAELATLGEDRDTEKMAQLPYLLAVCNEALRPVPTVLAASRTAVKRPFRLEGWDIPPWALSLSQRSSGPHQARTLPRALAVSGRSASWSVT